MNTSPSTDYELLFRSLFNSGRGYVFPCDREGQVALAELSERARDNYYHSRTAVGFELAVPVVQPRAPH